MSSISAQLAEALTERLTPYHYLKLKSAIDGLDEHGKDLLKIVLNPPEEMYDWTTATIMAKTSHLKLYLKEIGWSHRKIHNAFLSVKKMLREI